MIFRAKICLSINFLINISWHSFRFKVKFPIYAYTHPTHTPPTPIHMHLNILVGFCFKSVLKKMQAEQATLGHINTFLPLTGQ